MPCFNSLTNVKTIAAAPKPGFLNSGLTVEFQDIALDVFGAEKTGSCKTFRAGALCQKS